MFYLEEPKNFNNSVKISAALILYNSKFLLVKRSKLESFPGKWNLPGGTVQSKETPDIALKRELKEELNLDVDVSEKDLIKKFYVKMDGFDFTFFIYKISFDVMPEISLNEENDDFKFIELSDLKDYDLLDNEQEIIEIVYSLL